MGTPGIRSRRKNLKRHGMVVTMMCQLVDAGFSYTRAMPTAKKNRDSKADNKQLFHLNRFIHGKIRLRWDLKEL